MENQVKFEMPIWEKLMFTKKEAAVYSYNGLNKLWELLKTPKWPLIYM